MEKISVCNESPKGCSFKIVYYSKGTQRSSIGVQRHMLLFCKAGHIRISNNLFKEEYLCTGEILFVPRGSDYNGVALSDTTLIIHYFNNTVCHI